MAKRRSIEDMIHDLILRALEMDLSAGLAEVTGREPGRIAHNFERRVRRGRPGLSKIFVREEAVRRMAQELSCYRTESPGEIIRATEYAMKGFLERRVPYVYHEGAVGYSFPLHGGQ